MFNGDRYLRVHSITADKYGVDPLLDKMIPLIVRIPVYTLHTVTQEERCAPDLIALNYFGTESLWWIVLAYNGIGMYSDLVEGVVLKIPDSSAVVQTVGQNTIRDSSIKRVISI